MKYIIYITLFIGTALFAQPNKYEKIKVLKTAYVTEQLELTPMEAEKFWPVYNIFDNAMQNLRIIERREIFAKLKTGLDNLSDKELNVIIEKDLSLRTQELELRKQLVMDLGKILPSKKIVKLYKAEEDFKRELLHRYRDGKGNKGEKGPK